jgi:hypothetical protein
MVCTNPIELGDSYVPCGKCISCRIKRTSEWALRCIQEMKYWEHSAFVTLTYDPEHEPPDRSIKKEDLQKYFKRLRKELGKSGRRMKYLACGEYGETTNRPHYHAIIFGLSPASPLLKEKWPHGFVYTGTVTYKSARYVAGYVLKKINGRKGINPYAPKEPPFQTVSNGLGEQWARENEAYLKNNLNCTIQGKSVGLPRYYVKKLNIDLSENFKEKNEKKEKKEKEHLKRKNISMNATDEVHDHWRKQLEGKMVNNEARQKMFKKEKI